MVMKRDPRAPNSKAQVLLSLNLDTFGPKVGYYLSALGPNVGGIC